MWPRARSKAIRETNRSEKPSFDRRQPSARPSLLSTPAPSAPTSSTPPGRDTTAFTTRSLLVTSRQVAVPFSETQRPSVVPAKKVSAASRAWANARVRRLLAGMPGTLAQRAPPFVER